MLPHKAPPRLHRVIPGMADDPDLRGDPRSNVFLTAALSTGVASRPVRIRNLSANGALLEGQNLPDVGTQSVLRRGSFSASGAIVWQKQKYCGIQFDGLIDVNEWVKGAGPAGQKVIDAKIAKFRGASRSSVPISTSVDLSDIAESLGRACERIAALPNMSTELAEELLKMDAIVRAIQLAARHRAK